MNGVVTTRTVLALRPEGIEVLHHAQEGPARRRWKRVSLALAALLLYGPAVGLTVAVLRWDAARTQEVAILAAQLEEARTEGDCWRQLARQRVRPPWVEGEGWVRRCLDRTER